MTSFPRSTTRRCNPDATEEPVTVLILSRNRPLYLWACLDSLYRNTEYPARFVLVDNHSTDPAIPRVVRGFVRRGLIDHVEWHEANDPKRVLEAVRRYRDGPAEHIVVIESDVVVFDTSPCWLTQMVDLMAKHPKLGFLGSYVDGSDFVSYEKASSFLPNVVEADIKSLIKFKSFERSLPLEPPEDDLIDPFNPPGRLIMARKSILPQLVFATDGELYRHAKEAGIQAGIATQVRHRHLSLLNVYDYPKYKTVARTTFFNNNKEGVPIDDE